MVTLKELESLIEMNEKPLAFYITGGVAINFYLNERLINDIDVISQEIKFNQYLLHFLYEAKENEVYFDLKDTRFNQLLHED